MMTNLTNLRMLRTASSVCLVLGLLACSAKAPSTGTIRSQTSGEENVEAGKGSTKTPTLGENEAAAGETETPSEIGEVASNEPMKPDTSMKEDETVTPPVAQTGSNGDKKPNDPSQIVLNGFYFIKAGGSQKCLALPNDSRDNGVQFQQRECDTKSNNMKFEIEYLPSEKAYIISNKANQKFMEIRDQNEAIQAAVQQGDYFGLKHQMFLFESIADGRYHIKTKTKGLFLDVAGASTADGALIQLWGDGNGISSSWILEPTL